MQRRYLAVTIATLSFSLAGCQTEMPAAAQQTKVLVPPPQPDPQIEECIDRRVDMNVVLNGRAPSSPEIYREPCLTKAWADLGKPMLDCFDSNMGSSYTHQAAISEQLSPKDDRFKDTLSLCTMATAKERAAEKTETAKLEQKRKDYLAHSPTAMQLLREHPEVAREPANSALSLFDIIVCYDHSNNVQYPEVQVGAGGVRVQAMFRSQQLSLVFLDYGNMLRLVHAQLGAYEGVTDSGTQEIFYRAIQGCKHAP